jgi:hypothetical protein
LDSSSPSVAAVKKMKRRSRSITPSGHFDRRTPHPVPANETTHSAYITQLLIDKNYAPIFHMLDNYFPDHHSITRDELVRRIMLVNEPPQGMDNMVSVYGDAPPEERAEAEMQNRICGMMVLMRMGFRVELGIDFSGDEPYTPDANPNEAPEAPSASSSAVDESVDAEES